MKQQFFRIGLQGQSSLNIDAEKKVIKNVILAQKGEAKGHGFHVEDIFLEKLVELGNQNANIKVRFGHPSMSAESLGTLSGYAQNHRFEEGKVLADIHLSKAAEQSPKGNLPSYILALAAEDPTAIMMSVVVQNLKHYQYDKEGKVIYEDFDTQNKTFAEFEGYSHVDFVEQGALTESLFSAKVNTQSFAVMATEFLNEHSKLDSFLKENPLKLVQFFEQRYHIPLTKQPINMNLIDFFRKKEKLEGEEMLSFSAKEMEELKTSAKKALEEQEALQEKLDEEKKLSEKLQASLKELEEKFNTLQAEKDSWETEARELGAGDNPKIKTPIKKEGDDEQSFQLKEKGADFALLDELI